MRSPHSAQADSSRTLDVSLAAWGHAAAFLTVFFVTVCCLTALNVGLIDATILAAATLATNGPLAQLGAPEGVAAFGDGAVILLTLVMVIGRVEPLVLLATLFPRFWKG
jgi:Trk-type K+ transport system membrane component